MTEDSPIPIEPEKVRFTIDSGLLYQLGEELVARPSLALAELVKNAYDADATEVTVNMQNIHQPGGSISVTDNGNGMSIDELRAGWMRIAAPGKRSQAYSRRFHRPLTGAKGVGRFAARRLGEALLLQSVAGEKSKERLEVAFDWSRDFPPGRVLTEIAVPVVYGNAPDDASTGVELEITKARDSWTEQDLRMLMRDLTSLQSPFPDLVEELQADLEQVVREEEPERVPDTADRDPGFKFTLTVDGLAPTIQETGEISSALLARAVAILDGEVIEAEEIGPKGQVIKVPRASYNMQLPQNNSSNIDLIDRHASYEGLVGARFRVYMFRFSSDLFSGSTLQLRDAQRIARENGGVRIYLNGFRVFPYGDQGDDWLDLDAIAARNTNFGAVVDAGGFIQSAISGAGSRAYLQIPKNNQVFGAVMISTRLHPVIGVNVSRERLIENAAFVNLKLLVQRGVYWMSLRYTAFIRQEADAKRAMTKVTPLPNVVRDLVATVEKNTAISLEQRQALVTELRTVARLAETEQEAHISELSLLRILASAGTTLAIMSHQLQTLVAGVTEVRRALQKLRQELPDRHHGVIDPLIGRVENWQDLVTQQTGFLRVLLSPESRTRRRRLLFREVVEKVHEALRFYLDEYSVTFENHVPQTFRTPPVFEAELYAILLNLLSNALKAILGREDRRIGVASHRNETGVVLRILDSGKGLPRERREEVFAPLVTDSIPDPLLGIGTGLGLKVVRDIVAQYGGTVNFVDAPDDWATCVEIFIPTNSKR